MRIGLLAAAASVCLSLAATLPAQAIPLGYALSDGGVNWGAAWGGDFNTIGERAVGHCGGASAGCKPVMEIDGDCMAFVEAKSDSGYWFWVGATVAENAYNRSGELKKVEDMVMGWCTASGVPANCAVKHLTCMDYITNLN